ncbi:Nitric oxide synthase-like protein [Blattella germanica]|nr:Nitric oxide synthase-like protein [Blattella germanica]
MKLGWKGARTNWDILPLVLSANGHDPDYFDLPKELVMEVPLSHPTYEWFEKLGLRWYALPATVAMRMGLDTRTPVTLWKDKALVEVNLAVLHSFQDAAWKSHQWKKGRELGKSKKPRRKFHFKQIARAVKFTSKLFGRALSRRIKATVLYATETGKSEMYAKKLGEIFGHAFNSQVFAQNLYAMKMNDSVGLTNGGDDKFR